MDIELFPLVTALGLLAVSVVIHALAFVVLFNWLKDLRLPHAFGFFTAAWILVRVALLTVTAHLLEIVVWALAYIWLGAFEVFDTALYFSEVTYTTVGYGDVTIPNRWHLVAGMEGLTGILMAGWSGAMLFAVIMRLLQYEPAPATDSSGAPE